MSIQPCNTRAKLRQFALLCNHTPVPITRRLELVSFIARNGGEAYRQKRPTRSPYLTCTTNCRKFLLWHVSFVFVYGPMGQTRVLRAYGPHKSKGAMQAVDKVASGDIEAGRRPTTPCQIAPSRRTNAARDPRGIPGLVHTRSGASNSPWRPTRGARAPSDPKEQARVPAAQPGKEEGHFRPNDAHWPERLLPPPDDQVGQPPAARSEAARSSEQKQVA